MNFKTDIKHTKSINIFKKIVSKKHENVLFLCKIHSLKNPYMFET